MNELVGLFPAAGRGSRLGTIPCSKEIMRLGFRSNHEASDETAVQNTWNPVTAIETHLAAFRLAGVQRVGIVIGQAKWDIVRYLGDGLRYGLPIAYFFQEHLYGMPFALDLAFPWLANATVLFSMPDTLITPKETLAKLVAHHQQQNADITLGLFPTDTPYKFGMVELDENGRIIQFVDKPSQTNLKLMWGCAVWSPKFTRFMHHYLINLQTPNKEIVLSDLFAAALEAGHHFSSFQMKNGHYHDIGTPESFQAAVYDLARQQVANQDEISGK